MVKENNKSFMYGAAILMIANLIVKVIGAGLKIPLTYIIGEAGMGVFTTAYTIYTFLFVIATAGLPVAISKMIAESNALGKGRQMKRVFQSSLIILGIIGVAGSAALYFFADAFAAFQGDELVAHSIRAIAPAMLFVSFMSVFRGFFQGQQDMLPTAASEVIEALGKLIFGYSLAYIFIKNGFEFGAAGAIAGVSIGAGLGFILLIIIFITKRGSRDFSAGDQSSMPMGEVLKKLAAIAVPITIGASVFTLTSVIDMLMIMRRLQSAGISLDRARELWGSYSGYAVPLFNLPTTVISPISISIVPAITRYYTLKQTDRINSTISSAIRMTLLIALPCAVGLSLLSAPILSLVYDNINASLTLSILSIAIIPVSLVLISTAILQAAGHVMIPVVNMAVGGIVKIVINYFLVAMPEINIAGAPIGTNVCYVIILALNLIQIKRILSAKYSITDMVIKPLVSVTAMGAAVLLVYKLIAGQGRLLDALVPIAAGAAVYLAMLFLVRAVKPEDVLMLPKGEKLLGALKRIKLM